MWIDVLDEHGNIIMTVVADPEFAEMLWPGRWQIHVYQPPNLEEPEDPPEA